MKEWATTICLLLLGMACMGVGLILIAGVLAVLI